MIVQHYSEYDHCHAQQVWVEIVRYQDGGRARCEWRSNKYGRCSPFEASFEIDPFPAAEL